MRRGMMDHADAKLREFRTSSGHGRVLFSLSLSRLPDFSRLSLEEQQVCMALPIARRQSWTTARLAIKDLAVGELGGCSDEWQVRSGIGGRPRLFRRQDLSRLDSWAAPRDISISYHREYVLAALSDQLIGADVICPGMGRRDVSHLLGDPAEFRLMQAKLPGTASMWSLQDLLFCIKEAALKRVGVPLRIPRKQVRIESVRLSLGGPSRLECAVRCLDSMASGDIAAVIVLKIYQAYCALAVSDF